MALRLTLPGDKPRPPETAPPALAPAAGLLSAAYQRALLRRLANGPAAPAGFYAASNAAPPPGTRLPLRATSRLDIVRDERGRIAEVGGVRVVRDDKGNIIGVEK